MASLSIERIQAPSGGMNADASPDYVGATQAPSLVNLLPGFPGKVVMRGPLRGAPISGFPVSGPTPTCWWTFDDSMLISTDGGVTTYRVDSGAKTNVTATLAEIPNDYNSTRYGAYAYGPILDAAYPALGRWNGLAAAIVQQTNAPYQFTDLQAYAQRLFVLGGTLPGTTTPILNSSRVLFWTDPDPAADLSLVASWRDDTVTVPVINQLQYDGDDTPVGLANCGRYMAILGTRSINILTGSGSSSFAIRNLTKNWGCLTKRSIVEVDDGFYFQSDRGFCFCDGTTVTVVSDPVVTNAIAATASAGTYTAAAFDRGYIALATTGTCWLFHSPTRTWSQITITATAADAVMRTNSRPYLWLGNKLFDAYELSNPALGLPGGLDHNGTTNVVISSSWTSRFTRLASPGQLATIQRILFEYEFYNDPAGATDTNAWRVRVLDTLGNVLTDVTTTSQKVSARRQRFQVDCMAEADAVQLVVTNAAAGTTSPVAAEIYDAYIEYVPAQNRSSN